MQRRHFLHSTAAAAAASLTAAGVSAADTAAPAEAIPAAPAEPRQIRVGISGCGSQARQLLTSIAGLEQRLQMNTCAFYDPIELRARSASNASRRLGSGTAASFEDLIKNHRLDAVIIASPDHCHAPQAIAAMEAGLAVYCETPLAHTVEDARAMLAAQRRTGRLLQAGYQRRSNPRYRQLQADILKKRQLPGRITKAYSQWNRAVKAPLKPKLSQRELEAARAAGYADVMELANWRYHRRFSTGVAHALGSYGVHTVNWLLGALPDRVIASGGTDYYDGREGRPLMESPDNFTAVFRYTIGGHTVRYTCLVNLDTSSGGYYEKIMGLDGWAIISERHEAGNEVFREVDSEESIVKYDSAWREGVLTQLSYAVPLTETSRIAGTIDGWTGPSDGIPGFFAFSRQEDKPPLYYHLDNFFTILKKGGTQAELACPVEDAWTTQVCMNKLQESMDQRREVEITAADFAV